MPSALSLLPLFANSFTAWPLFAHDLTHDPAHPRAQTSNGERATAVGLGCFFRSPCVQERPCHGNFWQEILLRVKPLVPHGNKCADDAGKRIPRSRGGEKRRSHR